MYYLAKSGQDDPSYLSKTTSPFRNDDAVTHMPLYQMKQPYRLRLISLHPQDEENYYSMTTIAPDNVVYTILSKAEYAPLIPTSLHQHDYYEFLFVLSGELYQNIENERHLYPEGSCCILNKNIRHMEEYSTEYRVIYLELSEQLLLQIHSMFSLSYFREDTLVLPRDMNAFFQDNVLAEGRNGTKDYIDFIPLHNQKWQVGHLHRLFETMISETLSPGQGSTLVINDHLYRLFVTLADKTAYTPTPVRIGTNMENQIFNQITETFLAHNGHLTRQKLEKELNYSGNYLNFITKKYTGLSLLEYGMTFCMKHVRDLLRDTDMSVAEIAVELGFSNRTQFYKKFDEFYHMTPAQYRKKYRRKQAGEAL